MNLNKSYVLQAFTGTPWAILPSKYAMLEEILVRHISGEKLSAEEIQARTHGAAARPDQRQVKSVAVLPLFGTIIPRADYFEEASGATSAESFGAQFAKLVNDPNVDAIVLDVNSPGGQIGGIPEVSKQIFDARGTKPIVAVANQLMASAAYWICTAADQLVVTPSGEVGSIGVFSVHKDMSAALQQDGVKLSIISAGKYKVEGNPYEPLTEEARASIQARVGEAYDAFVNAVARNRAVSPDAVRNGFGEGRVVSADQAVALGMADRVATLDEVVNDLLNTNASPASKLAGVTDQSKLSGQEPAHLSAKQAARARLESAGQKQFEGDTPMYRQLLKQRADKVARAEQIVKSADAEDRDLNEAERAEFAQLLGAGESAGEVGALDAQIEQIQVERGKLRAAADKKFAAVDPEKPEPSGKVNSLKRAEFNKLDTSAQAAFVKNNGKLED